MLAARQGRRYRAERTYHSDVSVALLLSDSESAVAPASRMLQGIRL